MMQLIYKWLLLIMVFAASNPAIAEEICSGSDCEIIKEIPYKNLVVGIFQSSLDSRQTGKYFHEARSQGVLGNLPDDESRFAQAIQPVVVQIDQTTAKIYLISQQEAKASEFHSGDLVRFSPHRGGREMPPSHDPAAVTYWNTLGCVAVLCRAEDAACRQRYKEGIYRLSDGQALNVNGEPIADHSAIDPGSMLPKK